MIGYLDSAKLTAIADAIRQKLGTSEQIAVDDMPGRIGSIGNGSLRASRARSLAGMFDGATLEADYYAGSISFLNLRTMQRMFASTSVTRIDLSGMHAPSSALNMDSIFEGSSVVEVVMPRMTPSTMRRAFYGCASLESVDLTRFATVGGTSASDYEDMFQGCDSLVTLKFGGNHRADGAILFPVPMRDELGNEYAAGDGIPSGAHTYTRIEGE